MLKRMGLAGQLEGWQLLTPPLLDCGSSSAPSRTKPVVYYWAYSQSLLFIVNLLSHSSCLFS